MLLLIILFIEYFDNLHEQLHVQIKFKSAPIFNFFWLHFILIVHLRHSTNYK